MPNNWKLTQIFIDARLSIGDGKLVPPLLVLIVMLEMIIIIFFFALHRERKCAREPFECISWHDALLLAHNTIYGAFFCSVSLSLSSNATNTKNGAHFFCSEMIVYRGQSGGNRGVCFAIYLLQQCVWLMRAGIENNCVWHTYYEINSKSARLAAQPFAFASLQRDIGLDFRSRSGRREWPITHYSYSQWIWLEMK